MSCASAVRKSMTFLSQSIYLGVFVSAYQRFWDKVETIQFQDLLQKKKKKTQNPIIAFNFKMKVKVFSQLLKL